MRLGYINSGYDPRDLILDCSVDKIKSEQLPDYYDFTKFLNVKCKNQGDEPFCVPYSIGLSIECRKSLNGVKDYWIDTDDIFSQGGKEDGMMIRDALKYIKKVGYKKEGTNDRERISMYGKILSFHAIRQNVYINGPCILALKVRDTERENFWKGEYVLGGHAIACVGWNKEGLILMNSWGKGFGKGGRCILPYEEYNKDNVYECWGFIS